MSDTGLRGHKLKIYKPQVHLDIRKYLFSIRVIKEWNSLSVELINCNTVEWFKKRINCYFRNRGYYISSHWASFLMIATFGWLVELSWIVTFSMTLSDLRRSFRLILLEIHCCYIVYAADVRPVSDGLSFLLILWPPIFKLW